MTVHVVDLGLGNLRSVARGLERAGARGVRVTRDPAEVAGATRLVVPGQGAFRDAARALEGDLGSALVRKLDEGVPYLGICLGMQVLFESSAEAPGQQGLGWLPGHVRRFRTGIRDARGRLLKVPHIGWSSVRSTHPVVGDRGWFYFTHSYVCVPEDPSLVAGEARYGTPFCAAIARAHVLGCQFHPEKSQHAGRELLRRFLAS